ncbi:hypothetical protein DFO66_106158 [Brevibacterium sanguinis]|uniref:Uncharacterized protein n=2 Tax=Brevibacterium TaxID=1696 RepID=A0A366ILG9_9MICO|nr:MULTISPECIES: hypothetical protein [Brevibacterium]RBP64759.1 hypothetical protein DFO66_106158 [Brevibacterium sanguinis]RBP71598.1 hypothetical protein DFO65_105203 [Brevibacterium celere]
MTWRHLAILSDHIHRLESSTGEIAWGIDHHGRDEDDPRAAGTAEVALPAGTRSLLLVDPLPGGLVLDIVRSYRGLTSSELGTLFLGFFAELRERPEATRLTLEAIGLDAEGRPRIIPGIASPRRTSVRRGLGEMLYEAAFGSSWVACLLPVASALQEHPEPLRELVGDLLNDTSEAPGTGDAPGTDDAVTSLRRDLLRRDEVRGRKRGTAEDLAAAIAEVSACLRASTTPGPLPLLPAERDLDPGQALTARLRAGTIRDGLRGSEGPARSGGSAPPASGAARTGDRAQAAPAARSRSHGSARTTARAGTSGARAASARTDGSGGGADSPRAGGSGDGGLADPARRLRRASRQRSGWRHRLSALPSLLTMRPPSSRLTILLAVAACLVVVGTAVLIQSWPSAHEPDETAAARDTSDAGDDRPGQDGAAEDGAGAGGDMSDDEVTDVLGELCERRAEALEAGDAEALEDLTAPGSTAAAADELIDLAAFAGAEHTIDLAEIHVTDRLPDELVVTARMSTTSTIDDEVVDFDARTVEFRLTRIEGEWKVAEVIDTGS